MKSKKKKISFIITSWLVVIVIAACVASAVLIFLTLSKHAENQTYELVQQNVEDVSTDIDELADLTFYSFLDQLFIRGLNSVSAIDDPDELSAALQRLYPSEGTEVNIVNADGIIIASSVPEYIGYDMHNGEQASEFLSLIGTSDTLIQDMREVSYDSATLMKYAGRGFEDGSGFLEVGITQDVYYKTIADEAQISVRNRRIGQNGYLLVCDGDQNILNSYHEEYAGESLTNAGITLDPKKTYSYEGEKCDVFGVPSLVIINQIKGSYVIGVYPVSEAATNVGITVSATIFVEFLVFTILFVTLIILLHRLIVNNMAKVNRALGQITDGNLNERVEVRDSYEFDALSTDINTTVDKLKDYIEEAAARIDADLEIAKEIQTSALPNAFPPFPDFHEFELFASMEAAKEVGGDFYDFYMIGRDTLGFLVADVSGKSIPGAMFMMRGKSVIKSLAESGMPPADVFSIANEKLCEGNEADLFITAWMGYLDLETGIVHAANAGHNPPVLIRDGEAKYVKLQPNLMLAVMGGRIYKEYTLELQKGDILFLYTDGVTEAMDEDENLYGEKRLLSLLSFGDHYPAPSDENGIAGAVCELVTADIEKFVQGAEQFDDITMLCIRYLGKE